MAVESFTCDLYPLTNYEIAAKDAQPPKDKHWTIKMQRLKKTFEEKGMRHVVEGVLLVHYRRHPHVLLFQTPDGAFKLLSPFILIHCAIQILALCGIYSPGGRLREKENKLDGLLRKLNRRLAPTDVEYKWEIAELISVFWRPEFDLNMYPYLPAHITLPKERREIYLIPLPEKCSLHIPQNFKLLAVPLFELYDNTHRYGPILSSLPQLLGRINFVCRDALKDGTTTTTHCFIFIRLVHCDAHFQLISRSQAPPSENVRDDARLDLMAKITKNYNRSTNALNLSGAVKGASLLNVLRRIRECRFHEGIEYLILSNNHFGDVFNSEALRTGFEFPKNLKVLDLSGNRLCGSLFPWHYLPQTMRSLWLQNNNFEGKIDWYLLPRRLKRFFIFGNAFDTNLEWHKLPVFLMEFGISKVMAVAAFPPPEEWMGQMIDDEHKVMLTKSIIH